MMDYEKAYSEALERARQFSEHPLLEDSDNIVEYIFPELKESEDERISRDIIEFILTHRIDEPNDIEDTNTWLTWLEKQGEQKVWTDNDYDSVKSIKYLLHELDNHNFDDWFNSLKQRIGG